jgi:probable rRNA maturation factor
MIYFSTENISEKGHYDVKMAIRNGIEATLLAEEFPYDAEVSVLLCDNAAIREKNREYREKDAPTDVLSFPMYLPEELDDPL